MVGPNNVFALGCLVPLGAWCPWVPGTYRPRAEQAAVPLGAWHLSAEQCPWVPGTYCPWVPGTYRPAPSTTPCQPHEPRQFVVPAQAGIQWSACDDWVPACAEKQKGDAAQFASMEFFHGPVIALNRRQQECFQRIDNNRGPLGATLGCDPWVRPLGAWHLSTQGEFGCDPWVPGTYRPKGSLDCSFIHYGQRFH